jgi:hypothetical protein
VSGLLERDTHLFLCMPLVKPQAQSIIPSSTHTPPTGVTPAPFCTPCVCVCVQVLLLRSLLTCLPSPSFIAGLRSLLRRCYCQQVGFLSSSTPACTASEPWAADYPPGSD